MKKFLILCLAAILCLTLAACGGGGAPKSYSASDTTKALLGSGAFSEELEMMDREVYMPFFGLKEEDVTAGAVYGSTGATAEELAVLECKDDKAAEAVAAAMKDHLDYLKESNVDYRPDEMPKLDKAVLDRRGNTVLFLVAADYPAAEKVLK